jgi:hypothetical protein
MHHESPFPFWVLSHLLYLRERLAVLRLAASPLAISATGISTTVSMRGSAANDSWFGLTAGKCFSVPFIMPRAACPVKTLTI